MAVDAVWAQALAQCGVSAGSSVVIPELVEPGLVQPVADFGVRLVRADSLMQLGPARPAAMIIHSGGSPRGRILGHDHLRKVVMWAHERSVPLISDERELPYSWVLDAPSILSDAVCDGNQDGLIVIGSEATGADHNSDGTSLDRHRARLQRRRALLIPELHAAGFHVEDSTGGKHLWCTKGELDTDTIAWLAAHDIPAELGSTFGPRGARHIRLSLDEPTEFIEAIAGQLRQAREAHE
ncbi:hypothetical protein [Corynebacterium sp. H113]|uniref:hypothetical protein n=1 Tax=Corynebacterium sp. H113 TaxID=3133419 RepID=UPI00309D3516